MKLQGFSKDDFNILRDIKIFNREYYKLTLYKNKRMKRYVPENKKFIVRDMNRLVFDKMSALMKYIKEDLRFKNFTIGMCDPKAQAGRGKFGEYRTGLWIWMVDKKWLNKIPSKKGDKLGPRFKIPQIQIDITKDGFTTAEIWFEKTAINHLERIIKHFNGKFIGDKNINLFCWRENQSKTRFDRVATKKNFNLFKNKLKDGLTNEAAIYIYKQKNEISSNSNLVEQVKRDLIYLISNYYEPAFRKIISNVSSKRKGAHKTDIDKKKMVETIGYDVVTEHYEKMGYEVVPVFKDNVGWDLEAKDGKEILLIEVKGLSGDNINIELTPNEYKKSKSERNNYKICVVRNAVSKPMLHIYSYMGNKGWMDQYGNLLQEKEKIALQMYI